MFKTAVLFFLIVFTISASPYEEDPSSIDQAFDVIRTGYPEYRDYWGMFSIAAGAYNGIWGFKELFSAENTLGSVIGFGVAFTSWTTFFDGLRLLWGLSGIEVVNERFQRYAPGMAKDFGGVVSRAEFGGTRLRELSDTAYTGRIMRMAAQLIAGGGLLYFFGTGPDSGNRYLLVPGIITTAAGFLRLLQDSPEEKAQRLVGEKKVTQIRVLPMVTSLWVEVRF